MNPARIIKTAVIVIPLGLALRGLRYPLAPVIGVPESGGIEDARVEYARDQVLGSTP